MAVEAKKTQTFAAPSTDPVAAVDSNQMSEDCAEVDITQMMSGVEAEEAALKDQIESEREKLSQMSDGPRKQLKAKVLRAKPSGAPSSTTASRQRKTEAVLDDGWAEEATENEGATSC